MEPGNTRALLRLAVLALVALGIFLLGRTFNGMPDPRGLDAAPTEFSAARASATLGRLLGPEIPHPVSSAANAAVRDRVRAEFASLGVKTAVYRALGCNGRPKYGFFACGTAEDIIAEVAPGEGKAIVLMAHYDSVPAGPGASDDQSGVATVLESVRALKARGIKSVHPIIALITDGEEAGLLGAASALDNRAFKARVGVVVNVEARGNQGPSLLFQTSTGDGRLVDLYAHNVPELATSSLFAVIYKLLPNDTDLTVFLNQGFTGFNFAFSGNVAHYHTPLDTRAHLSLSTLQQHGDNMLGVATGLMHTDFAQLGGSDDIYLTVFGHFLPRLPASWALPLAIVAFLILIAAAWASRGEVLGIGRRLAAFSIPLAALLGSAAFGWVLHEVASLVSGQPDPSYAFPLMLRIALGLGVAAVIVLISRLASARMTALSVWLWMSALAIVTAALLPGFSPYFLFPVLVASVLLVAQSRLAGAWSGGAGELAIFLAALSPLIIWLGLSSSGESVMGLALHPLFTVPVASGAMTLLPLLAARPLSRQTWLITSSLGASAAVIVAVIAGLQPAYSSISPQRLNIDFVDDHISGKALWAIDTQAPLPKPFRAAMPFSDKREQASPILFQPSYVAPAGATRFAAPAAAIASAPDGAGRRVTLTLRGSNSANRMFVVVPNGSGLSRIEIAGKAFVPAKDSLNPVGTIFGCVTDDCRGMSVTLSFDSKRPVDIWLGEQRYGLPPDGAKLVQARPNTTIPSQNGDTTIVFGTLRLP
ncbi:MAG TPA: M20/M25/M40 family metallo-hydrolase [Rhizomicrobium sp.]